LLDLAQVGPDPVDVGGQDGPQLNVLADQPSKHFFQVGHHVVQIQDRGLGDLPAAESQKLLGQRRRPGRRFFDFLHIGPPGIHAIQGAEQKIGITRDGRQEIVEIVGHAAGQSPHRLHFLGLPDLFLQLSPHLNL
jgi:hypothetical protein